MTEDINADITANISKFFGILKRRALLILTVAALVSVLGAAVVFQLPDVYQARSLILIEQARLPESYRKRSNKLIPSLNETIGLLRQQVMSRQVLRDLIKEFELYTKKGQSVDDIFKPPANWIERLLYTDPVVRARKDIEIQVRKSGGKHGNNYVELTAKASDPDLAARIVVRVSDLLQIRYHEFRKNLEQDAKAFLERQLLESQRALEEAEARLVAFREKNRESLPENEDVLLDRLSKLKLDTEERRERIRRAQQEMALINGQIEALLAGVGLSTSESPEEKALKEQLEQLQRAEAQMVADGKGAGWPPLRRLRGQIARVKKQLDELAAKRAAGPLSPDLAGAARPGQRTGAALAATRTGDRPAAADTERTDNDATASTKSRRQEVSERLKGANVLPADYERVQELLARLDVTSSMVKALTRDLEQNTREIARLELVHSRLSTTRDELEKLQKAFDESKAEHEGLLNDLRSLERTMELQAAGKTDQFRTVEAAEPLPTPVAPNRLLLIGMTLAAAIGLGLGLAYLFELLQQTYNRRNEIEEDLGLQVLATVPEVTFLDEDYSLRRQNKQSKQKPIEAEELDIEELERQLASLSDDGLHFQRPQPLGALGAYASGEEEPLVERTSAGSGSSSGLFQRLREKLPGTAEDETMVRSVVEEQFNRLRHGVLHHPVRKNVRSVLITSAVNSEGKTTVAIGLAQALARSMNHWSLLVETDLRRPSVARRMNLLREPGLIGHLLAGRPLSEIIQPTHLTKLSVISAGGSRRDAASLISSHQFNAAYESLRQRYDDRVLVLDAPPVLATAEPLSLAQLVDGIILVVRAGLTPRKIIRHALQILPAEKILGVVLNAAPVDREDKRYYYSYYYYASTNVGDSADGSDSGSSSSSNTAGI